MKSPPYPIPSVNHSLANLADGKFFAKIDPAQVYLQLGVHDASVEAHTIITHRGTFKVNCLQFGVNVAPGLFQNSIEDLLRGIPCVLPYYDDVLIFAATEEELCKHLHLVLEHLSESGIRANKTKCIFKTKAVDFWVTFLKDKATIAEPLQQLLENNAEWKWTSAHEKIFTAVKELRSSDSVLVPFNEKLPLILTRDGSPYGEGYVLSHLMPDGHEAPIVYASRTLTSTERNYSQLDKEALSITAGVKKFHYFFYRHTFTLVTDH
ncbi:hypothetical protein AVEN_194516-1 [Araneus ventricosus]|uniref:Reverse transcriptase domain-containing protein n=1 Tax=Araneus ventricosus TaxID=182803 RepID=A0A4Y2A7G0_ARAVE|nr:hypothetical protein AVEN_194516-1 [Araneus ventricosus]